jgi:hypothetical protein
MAQDIAEFGGMRITKDVFVRDGSGEDKLEIQGCPALNFHFTRRSKASRWHSNGFNFPFWSKVDRFPFSDLEAWKTASIWGSTTRSVLPCCPRAKTPALSPVM